MSSLPQSSLSLLVYDCTAPSLDFDLQEKFILHTVQGKTRLPPGETRKLCSLIWPDKKDCHRTTKAIQDGQYFTDLSKESDSLEHQLNSKNIDIWMQELSESEIQNTNLRKKILEREKQIKELSSMLQCEKINIQKGHNLSRSVKDVQAHLQCQIERKEAENGELKVKIQTLENKIAERKHQIGEYKCQNLALKETSEQKKIALKKTLRSQKQRAQRSEEAVKDVTSKIREHEVKLCEILSASDVWKKQHDRIVDEKKILEVQRENLEKELLACLTSQIRGLMEDIERKDEWRRNSEEEILGKLNSVNSENEKIYLENKKLKASLATLEKSTVSVEYELLHLKEKAKLLEYFVEQRKNEVQKSQIAVEELKSRYETVLNENKKITENKCLEADKVRNKKEAGLKELEHVCDLLKAAEEKQQKLLSWERILAQKCKTLRELELQVAEEQEKMSYKEQAFQKKILLLEAEVRKRQEEKTQLLCLFQHNEKHHEVHLKELENSLRKSENKSQSMQNYVQFLKDAYVTMFG